MCLVLERTGRNCLSCAREALRRPPYDVLAARGVCVRCARENATRGVLGALCYARDRKRREGKALTQRSPWCHVCNGMGHFAKTCPGRETQDETRGERP